MGKDHALIDLTGHRYGRLSVTSRANNWRGRTAWNCACDCGKQIVVTGNSMRVGDSTSCGCIFLETMADAKRTHGMSETREYKTWKNMKERCCNPNAKDYGRYGGRGITVCARWMNSFDNFYADMGPKPTGLSIERNDVNGNYEPDNCRWATDKEQQSNRRNNNLITAFGETHILMDWTRLLNISKSHIYIKMKEGISLEKIAAGRGITYGL